LLHWLTKKQGTITLVLFVIAFVYSLCMATPLADLRLVDDTVNHTYAQALYTMTAPIDTMLVISLFGCLIGLLYNTFRNNVRRIYYPSNFAFEGVTIGYSVFASAYLIWLAAFFNSTYSSIDFAVVNDPNPSSAMSAFSVVANGSNPLPLTTPIPLIGFLIGALMIIHIGFDVYELLVKIKEGNIIKKEIYADGGDASVKEAN
jgi:hypothetical protein